MLTISDLTLRMGARTLLDRASAVIARGWKVGLVGRNGTGKSTLLKAIREEASPDAEAIRISRGARIGFVAQEAAPSDVPLIEEVLAADVERAALLKEAETAEDPHRIGEIHARLEDIDAFSAEARAAEVLRGLGFSQEDLSRPCRAFSGGWRMRAALAGVLVARPEILLLDEPTNYLDLEGAAWLEKYLAKIPDTVLIVSHDRELLNRSVTHILALEGGKLVLHAGGYDGYERKRAEQAALAAGAKAKQDAERAHLQAFVDRFRAKASKAAQAQSRIKRLEKMQEIVVPLAERTIPFRFDTPEELASPLLELEDADLGYAKGQPVLKDVSLRLDFDDRIAIIGPNGQGKTTLVKSIAAKLPLLTGQRRASRALRVAYFSQDQLDELRAGETVLEHVRDLVRGASEAQVRSIAAQMGFGHEKAMTAVEKLSGGEKVRLLLGLVTFAKPHVLILDEPTSHLDIDSRDALIRALNEYGGAVLLITHDVHLAERAAERLWLVLNGRMRPYEGDLDAYRALVLAADRPNGRAPKAAPAAPPPPPVPAAPAPRALAPLKKQLAAAEKALEALTQERSRIDAKLADATVFVRNPAEGAALAQRRAELDTELAAAEEAWLTASEALDQSLR